MDARIAVSRTDRGSECQDSTYALSIFRRRPHRGGHTRRMASSDDDETRAEIGRLKSLPLDQLAGEVRAVMAAVPTDADRGRLSPHDIAAKMAPGFARLSQDEIWELEELVGEGVQVLSQQGLAQCAVVGTDRRLQWVLTRLGRGTT